MIRGSSTGQAKTWFATGFLTKIWERTKQIKDGVYFFSKKIEIVQQEREKIKLYNDVIAQEIGSVLAKRWLK